MRDAEAGWVGNEVLAEFPGLGLAFLPARVGDEEDARSAKERLKSLEAYFSGAVVRDLSARPLTGAYRVFYRQIGLDPDTEPTPVEWITLIRLKRGKFPSRGLLADALAVASLETEIPILALRGKDVLGPLGITTSRDGEALAEELPPSTLVVADATRPLALLFGGPEEVSPYAAGPDARNVVLYAPIVPGVPPVVAHEALWVATEMLGPQGD